MHVLNATHRFKFVDTWGYLNPKTKKINGMLGDLLSKESDIAGTSLFAVPDRVGVFEYATMVTPTKTRFLFRAPPLSYVANIYYLPFKTTVWIGSGVVVLFACLVTYQAIKRNSEETARASDIILLGIGAICQMGSQLETKLLSAKISTVFNHI